MPYIPLYLLAMLGDCFLTVAIPAVRFLLLFSNILHLLMKTPRYPALSLEVSIAIDRIYLLVLLVVTEVLTQAISHITAFCNSIHSQSHFLLSLRTDIPYEF